MRIQKRLSEKLALALVLFLVPVEVSANTIMMLGNNNGSGTGFIVRGPSGKKYIMTNKHVCAIGQLYIIPDNAKLRPFPIIRIKQDEHHDLCLLALPNAFQAAPAFKVADTDPPAMEPVQSGGYHGHTFTQVSGYYIGAPEGKVSLLNEDSIFIIMKTIPGNSGSPVFNEKEEVVAVRWGFQHDPTHKITMAVALKHIQAFLYGL